jgi:sodium transport system permease protein
VRGALLLYHKELLQAVRDRRTVFMTLVFPLVFYPLLFGVMGDLLERQQQHLTELVPRVLTVVEGEAPRLIQALRSSTALAPVFLDSEQAAIAALGRGQGDLVLIVKRLPKRGELGYRITIQLDASSQEAQVALAKVKSFLQAFLQEETLRRLAALGVKEEEVKPPFDIQVVDTGGQQAMGRAILAQILPYFLILSILSGAMGFGAEITAGEKERGTISTLLSSRLSREEIVIGKFLAILSVSLVSTLVSAVGLIGGITLAGSSLGGSVSLASLSLTTAGWILAVLVPLAVVLATLVLIVGSFARSQKEASMYLLPLYMLIILLGMAIMMGGSDPQGLDFAIPVAGSMAAIRAAIVRGLTPGELGWTFLASLPLGAVLLWLGVLVYRSEKVLFRL